MCGKSVNVLLVEDNPGDARLVRESFEQVAEPTTVSVMSNGEDALDYLRDTLDSHERVDLVLLDLNLPGRNGREILAEIKKDADLQMIPILILSSSRASHDLKACFRNHANAYLVKPDDFEGFVDLALAIEAFWMRTVATAPRPAPRPRNAKAMTQGRPLPGRTRMNSPERVTRAYQN